MFGFGFSKKEAPRASLERTKILQLMLKNTTQSQYKVIPSIMKLSTLALAALSMGTAHSQDADKKVNQLRGAESSNPQVDIDENLLAMCQQKTGDGKESCNLNEDCVWCDVKAVSPSCFSKETARLLPERVYSCDFSSDAAANTESIISEMVEEEVVEEAEEKSWKATAEKANKVQSFLMEGVELNLATDEVPGDFCDASSPLSLAGYMNGEFLYRSIT